MKSSRTTLLAIAAISAFALTVPAIAQDKKEQGYAGEPVAYSDEIIVLAPRVYRERAGRTSSGIPIEELTLQRVVTAHDLDLRRNGDVEELHRRIRETAEDSCDEIERASQGAPLTTERECVREATRGAMAQADSLIYARRG